MEVITQNGIYGEDKVYRFYSIEDSENYKTKSVNWKSTIEAFKEVLGKHYKYPNSDEVYTVIGLEDNRAWMDYYFILENSSGKRTYELVNYSEFYKNLF